MNWGDIGRLIPPTQTRKMYLPSVNYLTKKGWDMTTYTISEFKAKANQILRELDNGEEVIITRRGKPCGRLTAAPPAVEGEPSRRSLRGALRHRLPPATWEDFQEAKQIWRTRPLPDASDAG